VIPAKEREYDIKHILKRYSKLTVGYLLLVIGIIGLVLPVLPGTPFLVAGGTILTSHSPTVRRAWEKQEKRYPRFFAFIKCRIFSKGMEETDKNKRMVI
jgi:uncharacterized membrane protein YbaN (DUF454 family)